jgi:hypothetical protein
MASYSYRIKVYSKLMGECEVSEPGGSTITWTHKTSVAYVNGRKYAAGDEITIERAKDGTVGRSSCKHPWLTHRRFIANSFGEPVMITK